MKKIIALIYIILFYSNIQAHWQMISNSRYNEKGLYNETGLNTEVLDARLKELSKLKNKQKQEKKLEEEIRLLKIDGFDAESAIKRTSTGLIDKRLAKLTNCKQEVALIKKIKVLDPDTPFSQRLLDSINNEDTSQESTHLKQLKESYEDLVQVVDMYDAVLKDRVDYSYGGSSTRYYSRIKSDVVPSKSEIFKRLRSNSCSVTVSDEQIHANINAIYASPEMYKKYIVDQYLCQFMIDTKSFNEASALVEENITTKKIKEFEKVQEDTIWYQYFNRMGFYSDKIQKTKDALDQDRQKLKSLSPSSKRLQYILRRMPEVEQNLYQTKVIETCVNEAALCGLAIMGIGAAVYSHKL